MLAITEVIETWSVDDLQFALDEVVRLDIQTVESLNPADIPTVPNSLATIEWTGIDLNLLRPSALRDFVAQFPFAMTTDGLAYLEEAIEDALGFTEDDLVWVVPPGDESEDDRHLAPRATAAVAQVRSGKGHAAPLLGACGVIALAVLLLSQTPVFTDTSEGANIGGGLLLLFGTVAVSLCLAGMVLVLATGTVRGRPAIWLGGLAVLSLVGLVIVWVPPIVSSLATLVSGQRA